MPTTPQDSTTHHATAAHHGRYPAEACSKARRLVAEYLTKHGVPNTLSLDLRLAVCDAWSACLDVHPAGHPDLAEFVVVFQDRARGGHVFAVHSPTELVFPAAAGTDPSDLTWLHRVAASMAQR